MFNALRNWLAYIVAAAVFVLLMWALYSSLTSGNRAKVEAKLNRNVAGAAVESGRDAVNVTGNAATRENASDRKVQDDHAKIDAAPDAGSADAAGADSLCRLSPHLCREQPVQQPAS